MFSPTNILSLFSFHFPCEKGNKMMEMKRAQTGSLKELGSWM